MPWNSPEDKWGMPIGEDPQARREIEILRKQLANTEAMLCAVMSWLDLLSTGSTAVLKPANWKNAGITADELEAWWTAHKKKDEEKV